MRASVLLVTALLLTCCTGCFTETVYVKAPWPVIKYPGRPRIEIPDNTSDTSTAVNAFTKSTYQYARHIDVLETVIETYNKAARKRNTAR